MYVYHPLMNEPEHIGVMFMRVARQQLEILGECFVYYSLIQQKLSTPLHSINMSNDDRSMVLYELDNADEEISYRIQLIRVYASDYYTLWMLRHMVRCMLKIATGIDVFKVQVEAKANQLPISYKSR